MALLGSCTNISKSFGSRTLFSGISLGISEGERTGLIGPNGSGKSTLLQILAGRIEPDGGEIHPAPQHAHRIRGSRTPSFPRPDRAEIVAAAIAGEHLDDVERAARINQTLGRAGFTDGRYCAGTLSGGWKRRLASRANWRSSPMSCSSTSPPTIWISKASCGWKSCWRPRRSPAWW